jgi:hypothetical protein
LIIELLNRKCNNLMSKYSSDFNKFNSQNYIEENPDRIFVRGNEVDITAFEKVVIIENRKVLLKA